VICELLVGGPVGLGGKFFQFHDIFPSHPTNCWYFGSMRRNVTGASGVAVFFSGSCLYRELILVESPRQTARLASSYSEWVGDALKVHQIESRAHCLEGAKIAHCPLPQKSTSEICNSKVKQQQAPVGSHTDCPDWILHEKLLLSAIILPFPPLTCTAVRQ
jgi:hypothetical protein